MVSIVLPWPTYILLVIPRTDSEVIKNVLYRSSPLHLPPITATFFKLLLQ